MLAPAGAGKSRLTKEFVERVEDRATVLQGRCIPYGEGITYFPLAIMLKSLAGIDDDETREEARAKLAELMADTDEGRLVATRLAGAIGLDDVLGRPEEISWAVRRLLETLAQRAPGRRRLRRHPLGRAGVPEPDRVPRCLQPRRPDPHPVSRPARARRDGADVGDLADERELDRARAARREAMRAAGREPARRGRRQAISVRGSSPRPRAIRSSSRRCCGC